MNKRTAAIVALMLGLAAPGHAGSALEGVEDLFTSPGSEAASAPRDRDFAPLTVTVWTQVVDPASQQVSEDVCANCKVEVQNWVRGEGGRTDSYTFTAVTDADGSAVTQRAIVGAGESGSLYVKAFKFGLEERDVVEYAQGSKDLRPGIVIRKR